eukprot:10490499-Alexandrium_andersonii.AAC.1
MVCEATRLRALLARGAGLLGYFVRNACLFFVEPCFDQTALTDVSPLMPLLLVGALLLPFPATALHCPRI